MIERVSVMIYLCRPAPAACAGFPARKKLRVETIDEGAENTLESLVTAPSTTCFDVAALVNAGVSEVRIGRVFTCK